MSDIVKSLEEQATECRKDLLRMTNRIGMGHVGGSLSQIDILVALYFSVMDIDPGNPEKPDRDRFILSKGHAGAGLYTVLAARGYFEKELLDTFDEIGSPLQSHPDMRKCKGVDYSTGSLGQGLSVGIGIAEGAAMRGMDFNTYVLIGDGETHEGQIWEALMYAGSKRVRNLVAIFDYNKVALSSAIADSVELDPLPEKLRAFRIEVVEADGNDMKDILPALEKARDLCKSGPVAVVAHTKKGAGVSFMEGKYEWHGKAPNDEELALAFEELDKGNE